MFPWEELGGLFFDSGEEGSEGTAPAGDPQTPFLDLTRLCPEVMDLWSYPSFRPAIVEGGPPAMDAKGEDPFFDFGRYVHLRHRPGSASVAYHKRVQNLSITLLGIKDLKTTDAVGSVFLPAVCMVGKSALRKYAFKLTKLIAFSIPVDFVSTQAFAQTLSSLIASKSRSFLASSPFWPPMELVSDENSEDEAKPKPMTVMGMTSPLEVSAFRIAQFHYEPKTGVPLYKFQPGMVYCGSVHRYGDVKALLKKNKVEREYGEALTEFMEMRHRSDKVAKNGRPICQTTPIDDTLCVWSFLDNDFYPLRVGDHVAGPDGLVYGYLDGVRRRRNPSRRVPVFSFYGVDGQSVERVAGVDKIVERAQACLSFPLSSRMKLLDLVA
ncbi:MAG: hypothetical protein AB7E52_09475 [Bdellovibrionales bacterium]